MPRTKYEFEVIMYPTRGINLAQYKWKQTQLTFEAIMYPAHGMHHILDNISWNKTQLIRYPFR